MDEVNQFSCVCAKGWAGTTCQSPVPTCRYNTHHNQTSLERDVFHNFTVADIQITSPSPRFEQNVAASFDIGTCRRQIHF